MNIPEYISKTIIKKQLRNLERTLKEYKEGTHDTTDCSLCEIRSCCYCPWRWFIGDVCVIYYKGRIGLLDSDGGDPDIIKKRMRQIKSWIIRLKKHVNGIH